MSAPTDRERATLEFVQRPLPPRVAVLARWERYRAIADDEARSRGHDLKWNKPKWRYGFAWSSARCQRCRTTLMLMASASGVKLDESHGAAVPCTRESK